MLRMLDGLGETASVMLADYTFYGQGVSVAPAPASGEIPSAGAFRKLPDGSQAFDVLMRFVSAGSTVASGISAQQSVSVAVLTANAAVLANPSALVATAAGKTFYDVQN